MEAQRHQRILRVVHSWRFSEQHTALPLEAVALDVRLVMEVYLRWPLLWQQSCRVHVPLSLPQLQHPDGSFYSKADVAIIPLQVPALVRPRQAIPPNSKDKFVHA